MSKNRAEKRRRSKVLQSQGRDRKKRNREEINVPKGQESADPRAQIIQTAHDAEIARIGDESDAQRIPMPWEDDIDPLVVWDGQRALDEEEFYDIAEGTTADVFGIPGYGSGIPLVSMEDLKQSGVFQVTHVPSQRKQIDPVTGDTHLEGCRSQIKKIPPKPHPENWAGHHRAPWDLDGFDGIMENDR